MSGAKVDKARARFDALRARYVELTQKRDAHDDAMRAKYGSGYYESWLKRSEKLRSEKLRNAYEAVGDKLFAHVQAISPRDWSRGVPMCWVLMDLTYEDAVRPLGEPLSVVPPMSYGATEVMR